MIHRVIVEAGPRYTSLLRNQEAFLFSGGLDDVAHLRGQMNGTV
jgi:hypothetical protein